MARRPAPASHLAERIAALEAAWTGLPDKIAAAMAEAAKELTPHTAHEALAARVAVLETKTAYSAGASKVENRINSELQSWMRAAFPYFAAALTAVYLILERGG